MYNAFISTIQMCMKFIKENVAFKVEVKMANQQDLDNLSKKQIARIHEEIILGRWAFFWISYMHLFIQWHTIQLHWCCIIIIRIFPLCKDVGLEIAKHVANHFDGLIFISILCIIGQNNCKVTLKAWQVYQWQNNMLCLVGVLLKENYAIENVSLNLNFTFNLYVEILLGVVQKFGVPILNFKGIDMWIFW